MYAKGNRLSVCSDTIGNKFAVYGQKATTLVFHLRNVVCEEYFYCN